MYFYKGEHNDHTIKMDSDEDNLKKEKITIKDSTQDYDEYTKTVEKLKNAIQNEIKVLKILQESAKKNISKFNKIE